MNAHTVLMISGPLLLLLALPLWGRRVPPNRFYGVRTRTTATQGRDDGAWQRSFACRGERRAARS